MGIPDALPASCDCISPRGVCPSASIALRAPYPSSEIVFSGQSRQGCAHLALASLAVDAKYTSKRVYGGARDDWRQNRKLMRRSLEASAASLTFYPNACLAIRDSP